MVNVLEGTFCDFIRYKARSRCPIWGPGKDLKQDGVESDEGRTYTTWLKDMLNTKSVSVKANGKMTGLSIDGLKDSADRSAPKRLPTVCQSALLGAALQ